VDAVEPVAVTPAGAIVFKRQRADGNGRMRRQENSAAMQTTKTTQGRLCTVSMRPARPSPHYKVSYAIVYVPAAAIESWAVRGPSGVKAAFIHRGRALSNNINTII
jgi:hypothetical protein